MANWFARWVGHSYGFGRFSTWLKLLQAYNIPPRYWVKVMYITLMSASISPWRIVEEKQYGHQIRTLTREHDPIFIIGHWRSGTTYLHQLLTQNPDYGCVSLYQNLAPEMFLTGQRTLKHVIAYFAPDKRPTGDFEMAIDNPEEEDVALSQITPHAFYHQLYFPLQRRALFDKYVLFEGIDGEALQSFTDAYTYTINAATLYADGKQLVTKSPPNTARIPFLLQQYPNAKFIHIYRNPYEVFESTRRLFRSVNVLAGLQNQSDDALTDDIFYMYETMMQKYFEDKALIPQGHLVEVKYETLKAQPLAELERIYDTLQLGDFASVHPQMEAYINAKASYQSSKKSYDPQEVMQIQERWGFAINRWGYNLE